MEIERKFLVHYLPERLSDHENKQLIQGYLSVDPVVRVRKEGRDFFLTYKGKGLLSREEYNLPLTEESFFHLIEKADGIVIEKTRYYLPLSGENRGLTVELDVFSKELSGLVIAEVEFPSEDAAKAFVPPEWFGEEKTYDRSYHNSTLSREGLPASSGS